MTTTPSTSARVDGHRLLSEGAPHDDRGKRIGYYGTSAGTGRALCGCGAKSPNLPSSPKRKQWHREHKAEVLAARQGA